MALKVIRLVVGSFGTNSYILYNDNKNGYLIDPGANGKEILGAIEESNINILGIILTHGHGDHIGAVEMVKDKLKIPVYIHEDDAEMLSNAYMNLTAGMGMAPVQIKAEKLLKDGDEIDLDGEKILVIHTPGHTLGGISLYIGDILFSGDTLFQMSIGRTDFPGGDYKQIIESIKGLVMLPAETIVYPGHGPETTLGYEKKMNPFLR